MHGQSLARLAQHWRILMIASPPMEKRPGQSDQRTKFRGQEKKNGRKTAYHSDSELVGDAGRCFPGVTPTSRYDAGSAGRK